MISSSALDLTFMIGIFIQMTKIGDLILRPHQQRWVQVKVESLALYLSDLQPLSWYKRALNSRWFVIIDFLIGIFIISFFCILFYVWNANSESMDYYYSLLATLIGVLLSCIITLYLYGSRLRKWVYINENPKVSIKRFLLVFLGGSALQLLFLQSNSFLMYFEHFLFRYVEARDISPNFLLFYIIIVGLIAIIPSMCATVLWVMSTYIGLVLIFFRILITLALFSILILSAVTWRIAEYNKGAWSALTLIITTLAGIFDFYIRKNIGL